MITTTLSEQYPEYRIEDRSVPLTKLPGWVWVLTLVLLVVPLGIYMMFYWPLNLGWMWLTWALVLILLHEGIHAVAWKLASGLTWSMFTFGILWKTLTPYCHCKAPMPARPYRIGAIMPFIVTGLLPWGISLTTGDAELAVASALLISGAGGDLYVLWSVRDLPDTVLLQDHDAQAGCVVLWPEK